jgi:hypothetical protein
VQDLNDLYIFSQVVAHNGFTGAARALGVARSSIRRCGRSIKERVQSLEAGAERIARRDSHRGRKPTSVFSRPRRRMTISPALP